MRTPTPPLAPDQQPHDVTVYIVLNDFGQPGRAYVETDEAVADEQTVVNNISSGEYSNPVRVVAFNTVEGWSRDVTEDIARALLEQEARKSDLSESAKRFVGACWILWGLTKVGSFAEVSHHRISSITWRSPIV
jgi:hypothetical protein